MKEIEAVMDGNPATFGQLLKKLRLEKARVGLRAFAELIEMAPSNLSNIERDRIPPPAGREIIDRICDALGLSKRDKARSRLFDLSARARQGIPADVADIIKEKPGVPVLVRSVANKRLSEKKLRELADYVKKFY